MMAADAISNNEFRDDDRIARIGNGPGLFHAACAALARSHWSNHHAPMRSPVARARLVTPAHFKSLVFHGPVRKSTQADAHLHPPCPGQGSRSLATPPTNRSRITCLRVMPDRSCEVNRYCLRASSHNCDQTPGAPAHPSCRAVPAVQPLASRMPPARNGFADDYQFIRPVIRLKSRDGEYSWRSHSITAARRFLYRSRGELPFVTSIFPLRASASRRRRVRVGTSNKTNSHCPRTPPCINHAWAHRNRLLHRAVRLDTLPSASSRTNSDPACSNVVLPLIVNGCIDRPRIGLLPVHRQVQHIIIAEVHAAARLSARCRPQAHDATPGAALTTTAKISLAAITPTRLTRTSASICHDWRLYGFTR